MNGCRKADGRKGGSQKNTEEFHDELKIGNGRRMVEKPLKIRVRWGVESDNRSYAVL